MAFNSGIWCVTVERAPDEESVKCIQLGAACLLCDLRQVAQLLRAFSSSVSRPSHGTTVKIAQAPFTFHKAASQSVRLVLRKQCI